MNLRLDRSLLGIVIVSMLASMVLAACGGGDDDDAEAASDPASTNATVATQSTSASETDDVEATSAESPDASTVTDEATVTEPATSSMSASSSEQGSGGPVTLETAFGEIEFPANPERVIAIGDLPLDSALALGIQPVGAPASRGSDTIPAYLADKAGDITITGTLSEPDLEQIVALQPDVILVPWSTELELYESLSQIAPTFAPLVEEGEDRYHWQAQFVEYATVLGREAEAEEVLAQVQERIDEVRAAFADREGESVTVMRWVAQGPMIMNANLITGQILSDLGFTLPEIAQEIDGGHTEVLSLENLAAIDTDWLVIATLNPEGEDALAAAREQEVFRRLGAVEAGQVMTVNGQLWSSTSGPLAALEILNDIEQGMSGAS